MSTKFYTTDKITVDSQPEIFLIRIMNTTEAKRLPMPVIMQSARYFLHFLLLAGYC